MDLHIIETLVLIVHVLIALAIIGLVLIQHGKGADMGSGFGGGASNTVFGSVGTGNFLTRTTAVLALAFFMTSFGLAYFAKVDSTEAKDMGVPSAVQTTSQSKSSATKTGKTSSTSEVPQSPAPSKGGGGSKQ